MRRWLPLIVVALLAFAVATLPAASGPTPLEATPLATEEIAAACPWMLADDQVKSALTVTAPGSTEAVVTWPVLGDLVASDELALRNGAVKTGPGAIPLSGTPSAIAEVPGDQATGMLARGGGTLAADTCPQGTADVWFLPGGSTAAGRTLELYLFNPYPRDATVAVRSASELGVEADAAMESLTVSARSTRVVDMVSRSQFREWLSLTVEQLDGFVFPALVQGGEADRAVWSGTAGSTELYFPATRSSMEQRASLVLVNAEATPVSYTVDLSAATGGTPAVLEGTMKPAEQVAIPFRRLAAGTSPGLRVTASAAIGGAVVVADDTARGVTAGLASSAGTWLLPGLPQRGLTLTLWVMNTGPERVQVRWTSLGGGGAKGRVVVPPGRHVGVTIERSPGLGLLVEATGPVTVGWSATGASAVALTGGFPLDG